MKKKTKYRKKEFNLLEEYKQSWKYIKESKKFIYLVIGIFSFFLLVGYFIPAPEEVYQVIMNFLEETLEKVQGMSQIEIIGFLISNNVQSTFFGILYGVIFGIFPLISTIANGYLLGFVLSISLESEGLLTLLKLLSYGIFELSAVFISLGLGIKMGTFIFKKKKFESLARFLINSLRVCLLVVIPLLVIAGIIEGTLIFFS